MTKPLDSEQRAARDEFRRARGEHASATVKLMDAVDGLVEAFGGDITVNDALTRVAAGPLPPELLHLIGHGAEQ